MGDPTKMKLEELRKSFPALDDFSVEKLLGGGYTTAQWESLNTGQGTGDNPTTTPSGQNNAPGSASVASGGSDYFGGTTENDWGEMHDGGWGDDGPGSGSGGDSNPGGSEGGNGQNSSGNPGGQGDQQTDPPLNAQNDFDPNVEVPFTLHNSSLTERLAYMIENETTIVYLEPGQSTTDPIEGFKFGDTVYKVTGNYGYVIVTDTEYWTNYPPGGDGSWWNAGTWGYQQAHGGVLNQAPNIYWQPLFDSQP